MEQSHAQRAAMEKITAEITATAGPALPRTLTVRSYPCGKPGCRCHASPPRLHGPYAEWTRKIGGKTVTRRLTPGQLTEYQPLFDNARKLRALLAQLQDLTMEMTGERATPSSNPKPEPRPPETVVKARLTCGQPPPTPRFPRSALNVKTSPQVRGLFPGPGKGLLPS
jgi:hypothetical protein